MTVHRFFVAPGEARGDPGADIAVPASVAHQVTRVLRLRDGGEIVLLDGEGSAVTCRVVEGGARLRIERREVAGGEAGHRLVIGQALLRGDSLERVVQQGTELGVHRFALLLTERSVARDVSPRRLERLRAVARESAEQSERGLVPAVDAPVPLGEAVAPGTVLLDARAAGAPRLGTLPPPERLFVGPEGGFTPGEVRAAEERGAVVAWLGPRILRAESVAIAAAAIVLSRSGDFA